MGHGPQDIRTVVNFDKARSMDLHVHRVGRFVATGGGGGGGGGASGVCSFSVLVAAACFFFFLHPGSGQTLPSMSRLRDVVVLQDGSHGCGWSAARCGPYPGHEVGVWVSFANACVVFGCLLVHLHVCRAEALEGFVIMLWMLNAPPARGASGTVVFVSLT